MKIQHQHTQLSFQLIGLCVLGAMPYAQATSPIENTQVIAYSITAYPIKGAHLADESHYLDKVEMIENDISRHLGTSLESAEKQAKEWLNSPRWKQIESQLAEAYQGVVSGWKNGVMKVPAVAFISSDNTKTEIVYGTSDVEQAIHLYRKAHHIKGKNE